MFSRLISLGNDFYNLRLPLNGKTVTAEWRDIFIVDTPPPAKKDVAPSLCLPLHSIKPAPPFRIPHWLIGRLTQMGMDFAMRGMESRPFAGIATFQDCTAWEAIAVALGMCTQFPGAPVHWAKAAVVWRSYLDLTDWGYSHDCSKHHVMAWPNGAKDFGDTERIVRVSFSRCKLTPEHTLVVHIELEGHAYDALKQRKSVELPSREALGLEIDAIGPRPILLDSLPKTIASLHRPPYNDPARRSVPISFPWS